MAGRYSLEASYAYLYILTCRGRAPPRRSASFLLGHHRRDPTRQRHQHHFCKAHTEGSSGKSRGWPFAAEGLKLDMTYDGMTW